MNIPDSLAETILKKSQKIDQRKIYELKSEVKSSHIPIIDLATQNGLISESMVAKLYAEIVGLPYLDIKVNVIPISTLNLLPEYIARRHRVVVFKVQNDDLKLIASDSKLSDLTARMLSKNIGDYKLFITSPSKLHSLLDNYNIKDTLWRDSLKTKQNYDELKAIDGAINIIDKAIYENASFIHLEPRGDSGVIRFRINGDLVDRFKLPLNSLATLNNQFKAMAGLNQRRASFRIESHGQNYGISILSSQLSDGEKLPLKIIKELDQAIDLSMLGFWGNNLNIIDNNLATNNGLILVSGLRDSGKTTTLYSLLSRLNSSRKNIVTIEDHIKYRLFGVNQIDLSQTHQTYESAINLALNQDSDIILLDRVFDQTALNLIADNASQRLILMGFYASDTLDTINRLQFFNASAYLLAHNTTMLIATSLRKKLCQNCREAYHPTNQDLKSLIRLINANLLDGLKRLHLLEIAAAQAGLGNLRSDDLSTSSTGIKRLWRASLKGCSHCNYTGYQGRIAVNEVLDFNDTIKSMVASSKTTKEIASSALKADFIPLMIDLVVKSLRGLTEIAKG